MDGHPMMQSGLKKKKIANCHIIISKHVPTYKHSIIYNLPIERLSQNTHRRKMTYIYYVYIFIYTKRLLTVLLATDE